MPIILPDMSSPQDYEQAGSRAIIAAKHVRRAYVVLLVKELLYQLNQSASWVLLLSPYAAFEGVWCRAKITPL